MAEVKPSGNGRVTVEVHGLDVYGPTTGVVRSDSTGDAFFVRHARTSAMFFDQIATKFPLDIIRP